MSQAHWKVGDIIGPIVDPPPEDNQARGLFEIVNIHQNKLSTTYDLVCCHACRSRNGCDWKQGDRAYLSGGSAEIVNWRVYTPEEAHVFNVVCRLEGTS